MKIALIYVGHIRTWNACRKNNIEFLIDPNHTFDIFVETYNQCYRFDYHVRHECDQTEIFNEESVAKLFNGLNVKKISIENQIQGMSADDGQRRKIVKSFELFEHEVTNINDYDLVIKSRMDLFFFEKLDYNSLLVDCADKIILGCSSTTHINDTFAIGKPDSMKKYFNRFSITGDPAIYNSLHSLENIEKIKLLEKVKHSIVRLPTEKNSEIKYFKTSLENGIPVQTPIIEENI